MIALNPVNFDKSITDGQRAIRGLLVYVHILTSFMGDNIGTFWSLKVT